MAKIIKGRHIVSGGSGYSTYSETILADNPNLFFKFNNSTNNDSGISYPYTVNGSFSYADHGLFSGKKCADFPNTDTRHIEINQPALLPFSGQKPVLSIECLAYFKSASNNPLTTESFRIIWCAPGYHCYLGSSSYTGLDRTSVNAWVQFGAEQAIHAPFYLNQWKHLVGVYNFKNGYFKLYIDGNLISTDTSISGFSVLSATSSSVYRIGIGNTSGDYQGRYHGHLSHLAVYLNELSASRIAGHYAAIALGD